MEESVNTSSLPTMGFNLDSENMTQYNILFGLVDSFLTYLATEIPTVGKIKAAVSPLLLLQPVMFMESGCQRWWWI